MDQLPILEIPPRMVLELASGMREWVEVAADYGYSVEQWAAMRDFEPLMKSVEAKKAELKADGWIFRARAAWMSEELLGDLYLRAKDKDASFSALLETIKFTAKAAGIDVPPKDVASSGARVSISIDLGNGRHISIGVSSEEALEEKVVEAFEADWLENLGAPPAHMANHAHALYMEQHI